MGTAPGFDGDRDECYRALRARAVSAWGEARAAAMEPALRRTSDAVWKLGQLQFQNDERPGFFLADLPGAPAPDAWQ